jgi:hypothetical protein
MSALFWTAGFFWAAGFCLTAGFCGTPLVGWAPGFCGAFASSWGPGLEECPAVVTTAPLAVVAVAAPLAVAPFALGAWPLALITAFALAVPRALACDIALAAVVAGTARDAGSGAGLPLGLPDAAPAEFAVLVALTVGLALLDKLGGDWSAVCVPAPGGEGGCAGDCWLGLVGGADGGGAAVVASSIAANGCELVGCVGAVACVHCEVVTGRVILTSDTVLGTAKPLPST